MLPPGRGEKTLADAAFASKRAVQVRRGNRRRAAGTTPPFTRESRGFPGEARDEAPALSAGHTRSERDVRRAHSPGNANPNTARALGVGPQAWRSGARFS